HEQVGPSSERQCECELGLLAAGESAHSALERDIEGRQACFCQTSVEGLVQVGRHREHRSYRDVAIQRRLLRHKSHALKGVGRSCFDATEHGYLPSRWGG